MEYLQRHCLVKHPPCPVSSPDPGPLTLRPEFHPCFQPQCLRVEASAETPTGAPDADQARRPGTCLEELQLGGVLQELPHGSWAIVLPKASSQKVIGSSWRQRWDGERRVRREGARDISAWILVGGTPTSLMSLILTDLWSGCYPGGILLYGWGSYFREEETSPKVTELVGGRVGMKGRDSKTPSLPV